MNKTYRANGHKETESGGRGEHILRKGGDNTSGTGPGTVRIKISLAEAFDH